MQRSTPGVTPPDRRPPSTVLRILAGLAVALAAVLTPSVAAAGPATGTVPATAPDGVPAGFLPASTSWTAPTTGWVLGFAPCPDGSCPALLRTDDDARTWQRRTAPPVASTVDQTRIHFADDLHGWATDGEVLWSTHDGAATWRQARLAGTLGAAGIWRLASTDSHAYAIVTHGSGGTTRTQLFSSPVAVDGWQAVPGVAIPGSGGWDIATHGSAAYVALGVVHESLRMWSAADGSTWTPITPLCSIDDAVRLSISSPGRLRAMCSNNPHRGNMYKFLVESVDGGAPVLLGEAPSKGITTAFATTPSGAAIVSGVGEGATWVHGTFSDGRAWLSPLVIGPDLPMSDLAFTDALHGVAVWGGPAWSQAALYRTANGGHTWTPITF